MSDKLEIRKSRRDDSAAIESFYPEAFPDENLLPLVRDFLNNGVVALSLVWTINWQIVGHVIFTRCGVVGKSVKSGLGLGMIIDFFRIQNSHMLLSRVRRVRELFRGSARNNPPAHSPRGFRVISRNLVKFAK